MLLFVLVESCFINILDVSGSLVCADAGLFQTHVHHYCIFFCCCLLCPQAQARIPPDRLSLVCCALVLPSQSFSVCRCILLCFVCLNSFCYLLCVRRHRHRVSPVDYLAFALLACSLLCSLCPFFCSSSSQFCRCVSCQVACKLLRVFQLATATVHAVSIIRVQLTALFILFLQLIPGCRLLGDNLNVLPPVGPPGSLRSPDLIFCIMWPDYQAMKRSEQQH